MEYCNSCLVLITAHHFSDSRDRFLLNNQEDQQRKANCGSKINSTTSSWPFSAAETWPTCAAVVRMRTGGGVLTRPSVTTWFECLIHPHPCIPSNSPLHLDRLPSFGWGGGGEGKTWSRDQTYPISGQGSSHQTAAPLWSRSHVCASSSSLDGFLRPGTGEDISFNAT